MLQRPPKAMHASNVSGIRGHTRTCSCTLGPSGTVVTPYQRERIGIGTEVVPPYRRRQGRTLAKSCLYATGQRSPCGVALLLQSIARLYLNHLKPSETTGHSTADAQAQH